MLVLSEPSLAQPHEIYLFLRPTPPGDSNAIAASTVVEGVLESILERSFSGVAIRSVKPDQLTHPTVESYAEEYNIKHYLTAEIASPGGNLLLDLELIADEAKLSLPTITLGRSRRDDSKAIKGRLRATPLLYDALLNGIDPANLIYVRCIGAETEQPSQHLQKDLTLQLPYSLQEAPQMKGLYRAAGVTSKEYQRHCVDHELTEEDLEFLDDFSFVIEGTIMAVDEGFVVPLRIDMGGRYERLRSQPLAPGDAVEDLAVHISRCWNNWTDSTCR